MSGLALPTGDPVGGPAARAAARRELSRSEYRRDQPGPISRAAHWLLHRLESLTSGGATSHGLLIVLVVVLVAGILVAARTGLPGRVARRRPGSETGDLLAAVAAADHRRLAQRYEAEGRRAEALREWLRAAIATIEERGVLPPRPGRTGAATAREAGPLLPAAAADLTAAMGAFDEVWFGGRAASDADVRRAAAAADAVRSARVTADPRPAEFAVPQ